MDLNSIDGLDEIKILELYDDLLKDNTKISDCYCFTAGTTLRRSSGDTARCALYCDYCKGTDECNNRCVRLGTTMEYCSGGGCNSGYLCIFE